MQRRAVRDPGARRVARGDVWCGGVAVLRSSAKDVAENVMIVDLVRKDLGRVCLAGSITVPELLAVYPAPAVWHLVSTVQGELQPDTSDGDLLDALFLPASVTGTPKLRARELLSSWESGPRGSTAGRWAWYRRRQD